MERNAGCNAIRQGVTMDFNLLAKFTSKDMNIPFDIALNIVKMQEKIKNLQAVKKQSVWCKGGIFRIYIELWSQNKREAHVFLDKLYFDAINYEWIFKDCFGNEKYIDYNFTTNKNNFSGSRTREAFYEFARVVNE